MEETTEADTYAQTDNMWNANNQLGLGKPKISVMHEGAE